MKTYLDLYRVVLGGIKEPADIAIYLDRDADGVEVAMQVLRDAMIAQSVQVLLSSGRFFEILPGAQKEADAMSLARDAGIDLNAAV